MGIKTNVFASRSEKENYYKLQKTWGEDFHIYHNLPFLNVFSKYNLFDYAHWDYSLGTKPDPVTLTDLEFNQLKKTSIDYTLCDEKDSPILCIEFDGMQQGFNARLKYYPDRNITNPLPWRKEITELKLKVAFGSDFPFFVVGSKQFQNLPAEANLTILDGIIGEVLTNLMVNRILGDFDPEKDAPKEEYEEYMAQTTSEEREAIRCGFEERLRRGYEREFNPFMRRWRQLCTEMGHPETEYHRLFYPEINLDVKLGCRDAVLQGCNAILNTPDFGKVKGEAWLPTFCSSANYRGCTVVSSIARFIALVRLKQMRINKSKKEIEHVQQLK
jgi:hypothetical protein